MSFVDFNLLNPIEREDVLKLLEANGFDDITVLGLIPRESFSYPVDFPRVIAIRNGDQTIIRFLDLICMAHTERMKALEYHLRRWRSVFPEANLSFNFNAPNPWISRRFFPRIVEEIFQSEDHDIANSQQSALPEKILLAYKTAAEQGLIHGHLSPSNIAIFEDRAILLDPCILITFPWRESKHLAPEKAITPQADYYSLASTLAQFKNLTPACSAFVVQALNSDPAKRPSPQLILGSVNFASQNLKPRLSDMLLKVVGLGLIILLIFLGYQLLSSIGSKPELSQPEFTQAEILKAVELKNPDFFRSVAEYLMTSGDVDYFRVITSVITKHPGQTIFNARIKKVLERLVDASLEPDDVRALTLVAFFEFIPPSLARSVSFDEVSTDVLLGLKAISESVGSSVNFSNKKPGRKVSESLKPVVGLLQGDPNSAIYSLVALTWLGVCDKPVLERRLKEISIKEAFPVLRALWDSNLFAPECVQPVFESIVTVYPALGQWFRSNTLVDWESVSFSEKLQLCLGYLPASLPAQYSQDLITFPFQEIAAQAFDLAEKKCSDVLCRRSFPVIFRHKQTLTREQIYSLINLLYTDKREIKQYAPIWFSLKPSPNAVLELVLARDSLADEDPITFFAISYLLVHDFSVGLGDLIKLTTHKDPKMRRLGILKADPGREDERKLLQRLSSVEDDRENRRLLREKLALAGKI